MKKWQILSQFNQSADGQNSKFKIEELIDVLLENRGIKTKKDRDEFLHPKLEELTPKSVELDVKKLSRAVKRIQKAVDKKEQIVVFGDYDVDGITASAILWETLNSLGAVVVPYIPHRMDEGYGLSTKGIDNLLEQLENVHLIITVDNGIVAHDAVEYANSKGIEVIITDHHVPSSEEESKQPNAYEIVHTTKLCGAGVAYMLAQELKDTKDLHLELVALGTVADLVPLTGANRTFVYHGLKKLQNTKRVGLLELYKEAGLEKDLVDAYSIGHIIAPRLNAMGRMEYAMESLRLICTKNRERAYLLAHKLGVTNKERQELTQSTVLHARMSVLNRTTSKKLLFLYDESYQQGIVGLVAGRLVEEFYRPTIVLSKGEKFSKASARSVAGFNIIEFIRSASEFLVDAGGHPMAAGFTVETEKLDLLQKALEEMAEKLLHDEMLVKSLSIDCQLDLSVISLEIYDAVQALAPFGMKNPEPVFAAENVVVDELKLVGKDKRHLRLRCSSLDKKHSFNANAFGMGDLSKEIKIGDSIDLAYVLSLDTWNGNKKLQLKVRDIKTR